MSESKQMGSRSPIDWAQHLRAWESSGQTLAGYARSQGLEVKALHNARTHQQQRLRSKKANGASIFQRAQVVSTPRVLPCRVQFPNGAAVELGVEAAQLGEVLRIVQALSLDNRVAVPT